MNLNSVKKAQWFYVIGRVFGESFAGRIQLKFNTGGLVTVDPRPVLKLKIPKSLLPTQLFTGDMTVDCDLYSGSIVVN